MHRAPPRKEPIDVTNRALPPPDPRYAGVKAVVSSGHSLRHAPPALSSSAVSRARSEVFARIKPRALLALLSRAGVIAEDDGADEPGEVIGGGGGGGGGGAGAGGGGAAPLHHAPRSSAGAPDDVCNWRAALAVAAAPGVGRRLRSTSNTHSPPAAAIARACSGAAQPSHARSACPSAAAHGRRREGSCPRSRAV